MDSDKTPRRILLVEDDSDYRKLLITWINHDFTDIEIVEYDPVKEGAPGKEFDWSSFQVLVLDNNLGLEKTSGLDILQANYSKHLFPATILLTGDGSEEVAVRAFKYEVTDYLRKEWLDREKLKVAIENAFIHNTLERQRVDVLDEFEQRVEEESARISNELKKKYARVLELEKKHLQQGRQSIEKELKKKQAQLEKIELERARAEKTRLELQVEVENLKSEQQRAKKSSGIQLELETTQQRLKRTREELVEMNKHYEEIKAHVDKTVWKRGKEHALELMVDDDLAKLDEGAKQGSNKKEDMRGLIIDLKRRNRS